MQTKFAFKRFKGSLETQSKADEYKNFQRVYSEILGLGFTIFHCDSVAQRNLWHRFQGGLIKAL